MCVPVEGEAAPPPAQGGAGGTLGEDRHVQRNRVLVCSHVGDHSSSSVTPVWTHGVPVSRSSWSSRGAFPGSLQDHGHDLPLLCPPNGSRGRQMSCTRAPARRRVCSPHALLHRRLHGRVLCLHRCHPTRSPTRPVRREIEDWWNCRSMYCLSLMGIYRST